jgi:hypothetical protein
MQPSAATQDAARTRDAHKSRFDSKSCAHGVYRVLFPQQENGQSMQPLEGLRVLDFGHYLSGPLAGVFLADQGADVISITRPNTRGWNHDAQRVLSRGKRVREVDLKTPHGCPRCSSSPHSAM